MSNWLRIALLLGAIGSTNFSAWHAAFAEETLPQITKRLAAETSVAYAASPFSALSRDYFTRFSRNPAAAPESSEVAIDANWRLLVPKQLSPLGRRMAEHLQVFLRDRMGVALQLEEREEAAFTGNTDESPPAIVLLDSGGGDPAVAESFTIDVAAKRVVLRGDSPNGLRDAVVRLVDRIGFRDAPILELGSTTYQPRLPVRVGAVPEGGSYKDAVFFGFNAVLYGGGDLYAVSRSDAIPELAVRRVPGMLEAQVEGMRELEKYGLKAYAWLNTRQKFPKDDPVFAAHPEIRGALTWEADGEYTLCTSHPLVRRYLRESVQHLFKTMPALQGVVLIVGGEGFYHCHMRPFGVANGHTNCERCEPLGAEAAVAALCDDFANAARKVNPKAEVVIWPYSAEHVWAQDQALAPFLAKLGPGTALLTEIEKSEYVEKPRGVKKHIWDYSIDLIGPCARAAQQIAICAKHKVPVYLKSEPELSFEAPRLPQIPCMDRWADRAEALASCGATGAWVFPAFRPFYGTSTGEINKYLWWTPVEDREKLLHALARRIAGARAANQLREAWKEVSAAIEFSPELPSYYTGPYYLGPMHPMCANRESPLPRVFYGQYLFRAEIKDSEGLLKRPTFQVDPTGDIVVFGDYYKQMAGHLARAAAAIRAADPQVDDRHRLTFDAEASPILWFYHTARTHANFYESCQLRNEIVAVVSKPELSAEEKSAASNKLSRWREVLEDERENTEQALPILRRDMRLDPYYGGDHTFSHGVDMIQAKLPILEQEITEYLPSLEKRLQP